MALWVLLFSDETLHNREEIKKNKSVDAGNPPTAYVIINPLEKLSLVLVNVKTRSMSIITERVLSTQLVLTSSSK